MFDIKKFTWLLLLLLLGNVQVGFGQNNDCACENSVFGNVALCENMENYNWGDNTPLSPNWITFNGTVNNVSTSPAAVSGNISNQGLYSMKFNDFGNVHSVAGLQFPQITFGRVRTEWKMYIPNGTFAKYGAFYSLPNVDSQNDWAYRCHFKTDGTGDIYPGFSGINTTLASFNFPQNTWFSVVQVVDTNQDIVELWINNVFAGEWAYSAGAPLSSSPGVDGVIFWGDGGSNGFYVDDVCAIQSDCSTVLCGGNYSPVCVNDVEYSNNCFAFCAGYTENEWTEGPCQTDNDCTDCGECFEYIHESNTPDVIRCYGERYCDESELVDYSSSYYNTTWNVTDVSGNTVSPDYLEGTNNNS